MERKIRVGFVGTGSITRRIMADFNTGDNYVLEAVASRSIERAEKARQAYSARLAFGSYEELAKCGDVDLVYIATPHNTHMEYALLMLKNGKHVICEKPFALNDVQAREMIKAARENGLFLMEAMWSRFMPAIVSLKSRIDAGEIGDINLITANFGYRSAFDPESRLFSMSLAGGALMDVGVYPPSMACHFLGTDVTDIQTLCQKAPTGADTRFAAQLKFGSGAIVQINCATDTTTDSKLVIYGSEGRAEVPDFWHAVKYSIIKDGKADECAFPRENEGHTHEFRHAAEMILKGETESPVMPLRETEKIAEIVTEMRRQQGIIYPEEQ